MLETHMKLCVMTRFSRKKFFCPKNWENGPKIEFLNILKNFVISFYWISSVMKIYVICCVPAQIPYLRRFWFLRYVPQCSHPIRLQNFRINHISRTSLWNSLIFCMLIQIHINEKLTKKFLVGVGRNVCGQSGHGTQKLAISQEWIDGMNWFFAWWCKFRKAKNGRGHLVYDTLKCAE